MGTVLISWFIRRFICNYNSITNINGDRFIFCLMWYARLQRTCRMATHNYHIIQITNNRRIIHNILQVEINSSAYWKESFNYHIITKLVTNIIYLATQTRRPFSDWRKTTTYCIYNTLHAYVTHVPLAEKNITKENTKYHITPSYIYYLHQLWRYNHMSDMTLYKLEYYDYYNYYYLWLKLKRLNVVMLRGNIGRCWSARCLQIHKQANITTSTDAQI